jgi:hypothetical protein
MKSRHLMLLATFAAFVVVGGQRVTAAGSGTPVPTGDFASSITGSLAVCLDPTSFANESCSTTGALVVPLSLTGTGYTTRDATGGCHTRTQMSSTLPPSAMPPTVDDKVHIPFKITNYDPTTGVGDLSFKSYDGGRCLGGSKFDSTGAVEMYTGTEHFAVSDGGARIEGIITSLTGAANQAQFGSFILNQVDVKE